MYKTTQTGIFIVQLKQMEGIYAWVGHNIYQRSSADAWSLLFVCHHMSPCIDA